MLEKILILLVTALVLEFITFLFYLKLRRLDIADFAWGIGFVVLAWLSFGLGLGSIPGLVAAVMVTVWGLRLASHIYSRLRSRPEDKRYVEMRAGWQGGQNINALFRIFWAQGLLMFMIFLPVAAVNFYVSRLGVWQILGLLVWLCGIVTEATADMQLKRFLAGPRQPGQVFSGGLWRYSRHPNYFGEILNWVGLWIMTWPYWPAMGWAVVGPLTIAFLLVKVSGIPLAEKSQAGNPEFEKYKQQTSVLVPWFVKNN